MRELRGDPTPLTWEAPAAALSATVLMLALGLPVGQALAYMVTDGAFAWPRHRVLDSVGGLAGGHPGRGLPSGAGRPPTWLVYGSVLVVEVAMLLALLGVMSVWRRILGTARETGMASRVEIGAVLGHRALLRRTAVIRPDLARNRRRIGGRR